MTTTRKPLIESQEAPTSQDDLYTVPNGVTATIDRMTATNTSGSPATVSVNLVPPSGTAGSDNLFASSVSIAAGDAYLFPEIVGHDLAAGSAISVIASASGVAIRASGRETTSG